MVTHALTHDPVIEARPLPRVRPPRTPPPGRALVLVPRGTFLVDTTEHRLALGYGTAQLRAAEDALNAELRRVTGAPSVRLYDARGGLRAVRGLSDARGRSRVRGVPREVTGP